MLNKLFIFILILFFFINLNIFYLISKSNFKFKNNQSGIKKELTVYIKIKENLPIRNKIKLKKEYLIKFKKEEEITIEKIISKINLNYKYFEYEDNLKKEIEEKEIDLELKAKDLAIKYIHKSKIKIENLLEIGLEKKDSLEIIKIFQENLNSWETIEKIKKILLTRKQRFLKIMNKFIIFY
jgi:hypothetical protein